MRILFYLCVFMLIVACNQQRQKVFVVQPYGNFPLTESKNILREIKKVNPNAILLKNIPFPTAAYYQPRNRYKAHLLLQQLNELAGPDSVVIGLSLSDISTKKGDIEDWGVMGLGYHPGKACVISSFRLSKSSQFYKVALHELGHTAGLPHCPNKTCLMRDADGGNPIDHEKGFCKSCKQYLKNKQWNL